MNRDDDPDDRTHRFAALAGATKSLAPLTARRVLIELSPNALESDAAALAFLTICNLATRLGAYLPNLDIGVLNAPAFKSRIYREGSTLREQALWTISSATKTDQLTRGEREARVYDLAIVVGDLPVADAHKRIFVSWDGWVGIVGTKSCSSLGTNRIGALVAAAMAVAWLHGDQLRVLGAIIDEPSHDWRLNALTLDDSQAGVELPQVIDAPDSLLVGAGALGSTFTYLLAHIPELRAVMPAVDYDVLKTTNANRQITAPYARADGVTRKVDDLADAWPAIRPIAARYDELKSRSERTAEDYEIAVTAVDSARVRREVANDLPRVLIDGATGGLTIFLMRGEDPMRSCAACRYAPVSMDDDGVWATRLGVGRTEVKRLRDLEGGFSNDTLLAIKENGTYPWDPDVERGLRTEGWKFLERHGCGDAKPERDLPAASVSYVSALCGFLMAAQYIAELLGAPALATTKSMWTWSDVLREAPSRALRESPLRASECAARHETRSRWYRRAWAKTDDQNAQAQGATTSTRTERGTGPK